MKKLIAWILSFFMALNANVEYTRQEDTHEYVESEVYRFVGEYDHVDYRAQQAHSANSKEISCRETPQVASNAKQVKYNSNNTPSTLAYWFEGGVIVSIDDIPNDSKEYVFDSTGDIVLPYPGYLSTENLQANDCTTMEVICKVNGVDAYRLTFSGMECWYCDTNREELVYHTWDNPDANGNRKQFAAGTFLGKCIEGQTSVVINPIENGVVANRQCTVQDFFMQN